MLPQQNHIFVFFRPGLNCLNHVFFVRLFERRVTDGRKERLWCVFELAAFIRSRPPEEAPEAEPTRCVFGFFSTRPSRWVFTEEG